jgi:hypothetical protein
MVLSPYMRIFLLLNETRLAENGAHIGARAAATEAARPERGSITWNQRFDGRSSVNWHFLPHLYLYWKHEFKKVSGDGRNP